MFDGKLIQTCRVDVADKDMHANVYHETLLISNFKHTQFNGRTIMSLWKKSLWKVPLWKMH